MSGEWKVLVQGIEATFLMVGVAESEEEFLKTTIGAFKAKVNDLRSEIPVDNMRLLFAGKQLEDKKGGKTTTFATYGIKRNSTIHLVIRLPGGTTRDDLPMPGSWEKVHDTTDFSLKFTTTKPDCLNPFPDSDAPPRVEMSCKHAVDPNSLTAYCRSIVDGGEFEMRCPAIVDTSTNKKCEKLWEYTEIRKIALLNDAECQWFESKIAERAALLYCDMKECPGCRSFVERADLSNLRVHCIVCSKKKEDDYDFCWHCLEKWTGPTKSPVKCGREECAHPDQPSIRDAPMMRINDFEVPNRRACPNCGKVQEHNGKGCKMMCCQRCKKEFCFLCLEPKADCLKAARASWYGKCAKPVAPRQTVIPVWRR